MGRGYLGCFGLIIVLGLIGLIVSSCQSFEAQNEYRDYISDSLYQELLDDNKVITKQEDMKQFLIDYSDKNKGGYVRWEIKADEISTFSDTVTYNFKKDFYLDDDIFITCECAGDLDEVIAEGEVFTVSGRIKEYSSDKGLILSKCKKDKEINKKELEKSKNTYLSKIKEVRQQEAKKKQALAAAKANEPWTQQNFFTKLKENLVLPDSVNYSIYDHIGCDLRPIEESDGPTNVQNAYALYLSFIKTESKTKEITITDKEEMKDMAFRVANLMHDNHSKIDFNLINIVVRFPDLDKPYGAGGQNFHIGINTIENYFSKPRVNKLGIGKNGKTTAVEHDYVSFYNWIESNFTLPENDTLLEDDAWTTISPKSIP